MKLSGDYREWRVSQSQMAQILGLSSGRISQLIEEKIIERDEGNGGVFLVESLRNYYQSKQARTGKVNFWDERGLHERAKRKLAELKLKKAREELYDAATVKRVMAEQLTNFRNRLQGLPSLLAPLLEDKSRHYIYDRLNHEIEELLEELSGGYEAIKNGDGIREDNGGDAEESEAAEEDDG